MKKSKLRIIALDTARELMTGRNCKAEDLMKVAEGIYEWLTGSGSIEVTGGPFVVFLDPLGKEIKGLKNKIKTKS
jgi:hypothetical protein